MAICHVCHVYRATWSAWNPVQIPANPADPSAKLEIPAIHCQSSFNLQSILDQIERSDGSCQPSRPQTIWHKFGIPVNLAAIRSILHQTNLIIPRPNCPILQQFQKSKNGKKKLNRNPFQASVPNEPQQAWQNQSRNMQNRQRSPRAKIQFSMLR